MLRLIDGPFGRYPWGGQASLVDPKLRTVSGDATLGMDARQSQVHL